MSFRVFSTGVLPPNSSHWWFCNGMKTKQARTYTAVPHVPSGDYGPNVSWEILPPGNQSITVSKVFHILFGSASGASAKNLQVNVVVNNEDPAIACNYQIYEWQS